MTINPMIKDHRAPIKAYFAQADGGENHPAAWFGAIWFVMIIWMIGQLIISIPMVIGIMMVDPDFLNKIADSSMGASSMPSWVMPVMMLSTLMAFILYLARGDAGTDRHKKMAIGAVVAALISSVCLIIMIRGNDPEQSEFLLGYLGEHPLIYASFLLTFPIVAGGLFLAQTVIHGRPIRALMTAAPRYRWKRMAFSMLVFWAIAGSFSFISHQMGSNRAEVVFDASRFWGFFAVSLLLIPLQSATEEIVLRGYLNQGLARFIKNPWIVFFITSAGFAALHLGNPEIAAGAENGTKLMTISGYFFFGFFCCILTYIDGGLETAIGVHVANNLYAATIMGYDSSALPTPTVFKVGFNSNYDVMTTIIALAVICAVMWATRASTVAKINYKNTEA